MVRSMSRVDTWKRRMVEDDSPCEVVFVPTDGRAEQVWMVGVGRDGRRFRDQLQQQLAFGAGRLDLRARPDRAFGNLERS